MRVREAFLTSLFNSKGRGDVQGAFSNLEGRDKETAIAWGQSVLQGCWNLAFMIPELETYPGFVEEQRKPMALSARFFCHWGDFSCQ